MPEKKILGGILVLVGIGIIFYGVSRLNSFTSQLAGALGITDTGSYAAIFFGAVIGLVGLMLVFATPSKS